MYRREQVCLLQDCMMIFTFVHNLLLTLLLAGRLHSQALLGLDWDEVEFFYTNFADSPLREIAAHSIFWAWWNKDGKLGREDDESGDDLAILDNLRKEYLQLDDDLHKKCEQNEVDVRARWKSKQEEKNNQESAGTGVGWAGDEGYSGSGTVSGAGAGWDEGDAPVAASGGWDNADGGGDDYGDGDHNKENAAPGDGTGGGQDWAGADAAQSGDWADEVNTQEQYGSTKW